jgi:monofunctional biosynthetic peptidoglycan transglycosylase
MFNYERHEYPESKARRIRKWVGVSGLVVLLIPAVQVAGLWFINPPVTGPMLARRWSGAADAVASRYEWVALSAVPEDFLKAVWITEDRHFFEHWGFDWEEIGRALTESRASGRPARGASTITQQCARSLFLWQGRSWLRKGLEAYYTVWMELLLSKRRIFELYVNVIEFGDGVYGIEEGSRVHYGVCAGELTPEQAAMLVAILPQPRKLDPRQPSEVLLRRQARILERSANVVFPIAN